MRTAIRRSWLKKLTSAAEELKAIKLESCPQFAGEGFSKYYSAADIGDWSRKPGPLRLLAQSFPQPLPGLSFPGLSLPGLPLSPLLGSVGLAEPAFANSGAAANVRIAGATSTTQQ